PMSCGKRRGLTFLMCLAIAAPRTAKRTAPLARLPTSGIGRGLGDKIGVAGGGVNGCSAAPQGHRGQRRLQGLAVVVCVVDVLCVLWPTGIARPQPTRHDPGPMIQRTSPRVLVMGCGGIGGIIASSLVERGIDTTVVTHNPSIADAIARDGFTIRAAESSRVVRGHAVATLPDAPVEFDFVFLVTQPPQLVAAARTAAPHLRGDGAMVCFQNGLCEPYVEALVGAERVIRGIGLRGGAVGRRGRS